MGFPRAFRQLYVAEHGGKGRRLRRTGINAEAYGSRALQHVANPHLKSSLEEVWQKWPDAMDNTSSSKFRTDDKVNQWMLCAWNQAKGRFYPVHEKNRGQNVEISSNTLGWICQLIREQSVPQICINDTQNNDTDFAVSMARICEAFDAILPEKSTFEKY